jgi:hypothetical protein
MNNTRLHNILCESINKVLNENFPDGVFGNEPEITGDNEQYFGEGTLTLTFSNDNPNNNSYFGDIDLSKINDKQKLSDDISLSIDNDDPYDMVVSVSIDFSDIEVESQYENDLSNDAIDEILDNSNFDEIVGNIDGWDAIDKEISDFSSVSSKDDDYYEE